MCNVINVPDSWYSVGLKCSVCDHAPRLQVICVPNGILPALVSAADHVELYELRNPRPPPHWWGVFRTEPWFVLLICKAQFNGSANFTHWNGVHFLYYSCNTMSLGHNSALNRIGLDCKNRVSSFLLSAASILALVILQDEVCELRQYGSLSWSGELLDLL